MSLTLKDRIALCWRILRAKPNNLDAHAELELGPHDTYKVDKMDRLYRRQLKELVLVFGTHGHSGFSAQFARGALNLLLDYKPLSPLEGTAEEWCYLDYGDDNMVAQNRRCGHVFKRRDGTAYDSEGRIFRDPDGACYTNSESRVDITFPYTPTRVYVDRPEPSYG